jgi:hypothetical protein
MTAMSYQDATRAQEELERKRQIERELELNMKKISLTIKGLETEEAGLVCSLRKNSRARLTLAE